MKYSWKIANLYQMSVGCGVFFICFPLRLSLCKILQQFLFYVIPIIDIEHELFLKAKYFSKLCNIFVTSRIQRKLHAVSCLQTPHVCLEIYISFVSSFICIPYNSWIFLLYVLSGTEDDVGILPRTMDMLFKSIQGKLYTAMDLKPYRCRDYIKLTENQVREETAIKNSLLRLIKEVEEHFFLYWWVHASLASSVFFVFSGKRLAVFNHGRVYLLAASCSS